jgi:hypothetical protein
MKNVSVDQMECEMSGTFIGIQLDELGPVKKPAPRKKQGNKEL